MLKAVSLEGRVQEPKAPIHPKSDVKSDYPILSTFGNISYHLGDFRHGINLAPIRQAFDAMKSNVFASYDSTNDWAQKLYENRTSMLIVTISNNEQIWVELVATLKDPFTQRETKVDLRHFARGFLLTNAYGRSMRIPFSGNDNGATMLASKLKDHAYQVTLYK